MESLTSPGEIVLRVNGESRHVLIYPGETLLGVLRRFPLALTGAKVGCENGDCGACTIIVDNLPIKACMMLAAEAPGHELTTVEGIAPEPLPQAFIEQWAFQCGYCTPGFIMNAMALMINHPDAGPARITEWMRSNICRCTGYKEIQAAVAQALSQAAQSHEGGQASSGGAP